MATVEAIYQDGVFKPLGAIELTENTRVRLTVQPVDGTAMREWLAKLEAFHEHLRLKYGVLPDSTPDIAADRQRDE